MTETPASSSLGSWLARTNRARNVDLVWLAKCYGTKLTKDGSTELVGPCPICGGTDRFSIKPADRFFYCRGCARGGRGAIDLLMFLSGASFTEAVNQLTGRLRGELRSLSPEHIERQRQRQQQQAADHDTRQHEVANKIWHVALSPAGTLVEIYLGARGYHGPIPTTIKFLTGPKYGPTMVAAFAMPWGKPGNLGPPRGVQSVHLTSLRDDGLARLRHKGAKRVVARHIGLPIAVSPIGPDEVLYICEGIESALSWASFGGAWAAGSAVHMPALAQSIPENVSTLIIEQHDDDAGILNTRRLIEAIREREDKRERQDDGQDMRTARPIHIEIVRERQ